MERERPNFINWNSGQWKIIKARLDAPMIENRPEVEDPIWESLIEVVRKKLQQNFVDIMNA